MHSLLRFADPYPWLLHTTKKCIQIHLHSALTTDSAHPPSSLRERSQSYFRGAGRYGSCLVERVGNLVEENACRDNLCKVSFMKCMQNVVVKEYIVPEERKPRQNKRSKIQSQQRLISNRSLILGDFPDDPVAPLAPVLLGSNLEDAKACGIYCLVQVSCIYGGSRSRVNVQPGQVL